MTNLTDAPTYDPGVYEIQTTDPVMGGPGGVDNMAAQNLANRTAYLKQHVDALEAGTTIPNGVAPLASPVFTGTPNAPNAANGDSSNLIANTRFVQTAIGGVASVDVSAGGNIAINQALGVRVVILTGAPTVAVAALVPIRGSWTVVNSTTGSATVTVQTAAGTGVPLTQGKAQPLFADGTNIQRGYSDFQNVALTGVPTAPTAAPGDNSARVATTAYVDGQSHGVATLTGSGSWTVPPGVSVFDVELWAGGAGSFASQAGKSSGGAAAGGFTRKRFVGIAAGTVIPYVAGLGGAAGTPTSQPGVGGSSSFGSGLSATGGQLNPYATVADPTLAGSPGGGGSGGDLNIQGSDGGVPRGDIYAGGSGGAAAGSTSASVQQGFGNAGHFPGGGAAGAGTGSANTTAQNGAVGANGVIIVRW